MTDAAAFGHQVLQHCQYLTWQCTENSVRLYVLNKQSLKITHI